MHCYLLSPFLKSNFATPPYISTTTCPAMSDNLITEGTAWDDHCMAQTPKLPSVSSLRVARVHNQLEDTRRGWRVCCPQCSPGQCMQERKVQRLLLWVTSFSKAGSKVSCVKGGEETESQAEVKKSESRWWFIHFCQLWFWVLYLLCTHLKPMCL